MSRGNGNRAEPPLPLAYLLKQAHLRLASLADDALAASGVDRRDFGVLRALAATGPLTQQQLGKEAGVDPATLVRIIDGLESRGLLTRRPDAADRRRNLIALTDAGAESWDSAHAAYSEAEQRFTASMSSGGAERLRRELTVLLGVGVDEAHLS
ncbi:MarR family winged helix-turn-helix transcriptional regulator [Curtobacterium sp. ZW137]|uniref:MarR family winged helix-turn-helix transcriptional regulator n=1 Tax=Curtobacterium sp. ZW137 TaxID=2485104 RepID=UPI000F4CCAB0|nr:MarR family transcriptional regulator [Curtobacterium sp. ZW137]ROP63460.1 DNA-binding MarR family transcriptional regulator [Curtobacterium sp. ZW137]